MDRETTILFAGIVALCAAVLSYGLSFVSRAVARRWKFIDEPKGGRKIHQTAIPLLGGLGIAFAILSVVILVRLSNLGDGVLLGLRMGQIAGYLAGVIVLLLGGAFDDRHPLAPKVQILFPIIAALCVIASGTGIIQVTQPTLGTGFSLVWWQWSWQIGSHAIRLSLPSDIITLVWILVATYATKVLDGLDGLVTGLTVIGAGMVSSLSLSPAYFQPAVGVLSAIVGGAFAGFLPSNIHPAKQFLGESGATIAGFSLGVLAILSSAKIAIALAVLAIPIADAIFVVIGRVRRGVPWYQGDDTHLHFRLLRAGVPHGVAVLLLWGISLSAGIVALGLQTRGKLFLVAALVVLAAVGSYAAGLLAARRPRV
ncbi:MAG: MraY family glycosyltransferase [Patescibacteria group bacterium]